METQKVERKNRGIVDSYFRRRRRLIGTKERYLARACARGTLRARARARERACGLKGLSTAYILIEEL